jgi:hypothetical protein
MNMGCLNLRWQCHAFRRGVGVSVAIPRMRVHDCGVSVSLDTCLHLIGRACKGLYYLNSN